jgi:hypothetical protein
VWKRDFLVTTGEVPSARADIEEHQAASCQSTCPSFITHILVQPQPLIDVRFGSIEEFQPGTVANDGTFAVARPKPVSEVFG